MHVASQPAHKGIHSQCGAPVAGAYVRLLDVTGEFAAEVVTSAAGQFRFFAAPGTWTVRALSRQGNGDTLVISGLRMIRSTYNPVVRTAEMDILRPVIDAELLVLDDLGAEKPSEWVEETMNLIVNTRYNERRHTIFTSNYEDTPEDASDSQDFTLKERIGFRIHSRLHEMCEFLEFDGADYRHAPTNAGPDDLLAMWKRKVQSPGRRALPAKAKGPIRAQLKSPLPGKELGWSGGKAGS